jgi:hypothetical protein
MINIAIRAVNLLGIVRYRLFETLVANVMSALRDNPGNVGLGEGLFAGCAFLIFGHLYLEIKYINMQNRMAD